MWLPSSGLNSHHARASYLICKHENYTLQGSSRSGPRARGPGRSPPRRSPPRRAVRAVRAEPARTPAPSRGWRSGDWGSARPVRRPGARPGGRARGAARARRAWRYAGCRFGVGQQGGTCGHARRAAHSRCLDRLATGPHRPTRVRATPPRCGLVALPQEALVTADCAFHVSQDFRYVFRCRMSALLTSQTKMPSGRRVTRARHPTSERMIHDAKLITYTVTAHRERLQGPSDSEALPKLVSDWTAQFTSCPRRARLHAMTAQGCDGM